MVVISATLTFIAKKAAFQAVMFWIGDGLTQIITQFNKEPITDENGRERTAQERLSAAAEKYDKSRGKRRAIFGLFAGPCLGYWYDNLGQWIPGFDIVSLAEKVALDQLVFTPPFLASFFASQEYMRTGGDWEATKVKVRSEWWPTLKTNWWFWTPCAAVNYEYVFPNWRHTFMSTCGVFWDSFLSFRASPHNAEEHNG